MIQAGTDYDAGSREFKLELLGTANYLPIGQKTQLSMNNEEGIILQRANSGINIFDDISINPTGEAFLDMTIAEIDGASNNRNLVTKEWVQAQSANVIGYTGSGTSGSYQIEIGEPLTSDDDGININQTTSEIVIQASNTLTIGDAQGVANETTLTVTQGGEFNFKEGNLNVEAGNLSVGNDVTSNPFNARLNVNNGSVTTSGNNFPFYNAINKANATNNTDLVYGVSNLIEHDGAGNISQLRGIYNRARTDGTGSPSEIIAQLNEASYRNTGTGTVTTLTASDNFVEIENTAGTGTIGTALGVRGQVHLDNANVTVPQAIGMISQLDLDQGTVGTFVGLSLDVDQSVGTTISDGAYLEIKDGIILPNANVKVIESFVDLPSELAGTLEAKTLSIIGGTNDDVLLGDGTTTSLAGIGGSTLLENQIAFGSSTDEVSSDAEFILESNIVGAFKRLSIGVDDTSAGALSLYGHSGNSANSQLRMYTNANSDDAVDYWDFSAWDAGTTGNFRLRGIGTNSGTVFEVDDVTKDVEFTGIVESNKTPAEIETAGDKALTTVEYVQSQTGWAQYNDGQYTVGSPLSISASTQVTVDIDGATTIKSELPSGVTDFYDVATSKITPENSGDGYTFTLGFKAETTSASGNGTFSIDIGGAFGEIFKRDFGFVKGQNTEHDFYFTSQGYSLGTFVANGGIIKLTSNTGTMTVYDVTLQIHRTHKAN